MTSVEKLCLQWSEFQVKIIIQMFPKKVHLCQYFQQNTCKLLFVVVCPSVKHIHIDFNQANVTTSYRDVRKNANFSDVTLACEDGRKIEAHRIILSSSSEFFR